MAQDKSFGKTIIHLGSGGSKPHPPTDGSSEKSSDGQPRKDGTGQKDKDAPLLVGRRVSLPPAPKPAEEKPIATRPRGGFGATLIGGPLVPPVTSGHQKAPVEKRLLSQSVLGGPSPAKSPQASAPPTQQSSQTRENTRGLFSSTVQGGTAPVFLQTLAPHIREQEEKGDDDDRPVPSVRLAQAVRQELFDLNSAIISSRAPGVQQDSRPFSPAAQNDSDLPRVGRYEVLARLKRGGMGSVYLCRLSGSAGFQRLFAMKVLSSNSTLDESFDAMEAFFREAQLLAQLHHPNIVGIVDVGTATEPFLVLDYVEGGSLFDLCNGSPNSRDPKKIVAIMLDALAGLAAAHRAVDAGGTPLELVHCDLTPHNLLVGIDGACRIADFGIARAHSDAHREANGPLWGKPGYMAPERAAGKNSDQRSDIFSLGVALYTALTGVEPFAGASSAETLRNVIEKSVLPPSQVGFCPPPALDWVCMTALEKDPAARFQTADEMLTQLRRVAARADLFAAPLDVGSWVKEVLGKKLEERRQVVRRATDPKTAQISEAPPPDLGAAGSTPARPESVHAPAPPPPSSHTHHEATIMLSPEEQAEAARGLSGREAEIAEQMKAARAMDPDAGLLDRLIVGTPKNRKVVYAALAATVIFLVVALVFPQTLGKMFTMGDPPPQATKGGSVEEPVKIDVSAANPDAPKTKEPGAAEGDPTAEEIPKVKLPKIRTASDE